MDQHNNPLSERLRSLRAMRGYSQAYVAQCLGVCQKTYSRWENDAQNLSLAMLACICQVLGTNPDGLIGAGPTLAADIQALKNEVGMLREQLRQQLPPPRKVSQSGKEKAPRLGISGEPGQAAHQGRDRAVFQAPARRFVGGYPPEALAL
jgi:transcriptional regulator with XRE-family HTH domain